jgi:4-hydroxy-3-polyprenylbenzoate decarboxylase
LRSDDLQQFIESLDIAGELSRVSCSVDPYLEVATIIDSVGRQAGHGPALLFENVQGYNLPLAANLFASEKRIELALGSKIFKDYPEKLRKDLAADGRKNSSDAIQRIVARNENHAVYINSASCFEIDITVAGLDAIPALQFWPCDGGRYLTLAQVFTYHPETYTGNCGMYRIQLVNSHKALLRCHPGTGGAEHLSAWHLHGEAMPVAISLGGPPVLTWLAGVSLPDGVAETDFAGYLTGHPLKMGRCKDLNLAVPATAEIVIEGRVHPGEELEEGPFGNHTGSYDHASPAPVINVEKVSMRQGAIYPCTMVGPPPRENNFLAELSRRILLVLLQFDHPWVHDVHMPPEGIFHRAAMVAIAPDCSLSIETISTALYGSALLKSSKLLILLDSDTELSSYKEVFWRVVNTKNFSQSCRIGTQSILVDARSPKGFRRVMPNADMVQKVKARWPHYGLKKTI